MEFVSMYLVLPLLIFLARVLDVSLGTIRIIFISKGFRFLSPLVGFFEVLIWLFAIRYILLDISNIFLYLSYAGGFAVGTYVGILIDKKISIGNSMIRIIIRKNKTKLIDELKKRGYPLTIVDAESSMERTGMKIIFLVVKRKELKNIFEIIKKVNPKAFYTVEDIVSFIKREYHVIGQKRGHGKRP